MNEDRIKSLLAAVSLPDVDDDIVAAGRVGEIEIDGGEVTVVLTLDGYDREARHAIEDAVVLLDRALAQFSARIDADGGGAAGGETGL